MFTVNVNMNIKKDIFKEESAEVLKIPGLVNNIHEYHKYIHV